jgi:hypothetical protein
MMWGLHAGICSHVLDGTPLTVKKGTKTTESKKRRASEGMSCDPLILTHRSCMFRELHLSSPSYGPSCSVMLCCTCERSS